MSFITDSIITHIYPYNEYKNIIGTELSLSDEQKDWIDYAKKENKPIITAPVNLLEGGTGIIVRVPVLRNRQYFSQVSIVFNYNKTLETSGLIGLGNDFYIELFKTDEFTTEDKVILTNIRTADSLWDDETVFNQVNLYQSSISLKAVPKEEINGKSVLFYLILTIGWLLSSLASLFTYKLLTTAMALTKSESYLKEKNEELEAMINQLKANEEHLFIQYDEIMKQKEKIDFLADSDYLTGLNNRRRFTKDISESILIKKVGTILLFDIDDFKNINDIHGHHYGDKVLKHISQVLKDSFGNEIIVYRIGGDEFAMHLPGVI